MHAGRSGKYWLTYTIHFDLWTEGRYTNATELSRAARAGGTLSHQGAVTFRPT